jgi:ketosteroid isomerase-like protein
MAIVHYGVNGKTTGGAAMGHEGLLFFRFDRTGLIAEERRYLDSATPMAQLGAFGKVEMRSLPQLPDDLTVYPVSSPGATQNAAMVRLALAAIEGNSAAIFMQQVAGNATVDDLLLPAPFSGSQGVTQWFALWRTAVSDSNFRVTNEFAGGDYVILETAMTGTLSGPIGRLSAGRKPFIVHAAWIAQLKDGSIVRLTRFLNTKELADATGQSLTPPRH